MKPLSNCHDCAASPGEVHSEGCDVERCTVCGGQRLQCDEDECKDHDPIFARWTGIWPGKAEADFLGVDLNEFERLGLPRVFFIKPKFSNQPSELERLRELNQHLIDLEVELNEKLDNYLETIEWIIKHASHYIRENASWDHYVYLDKSFEKDIRKKLKITEGGHNEDSKRNKS